MKKSIKVLLFIFILCPIILLSACTSPPTYLITALPSDMRLGKVVGSYNNEQLAEGTTITLTANESNSQSNPFICWIKDYKTVVSNEKELSLTYGQSTTGHYTAVFEETNLSNMMFASLNNIFFNPEGYQSIDWTISYARTTSGSSYTDLETGSFAPGEFDTNNQSIIYFGSAGANYEYSIQVNLTLTTATGATTEYTVSFHDLLTKNIFDENGSATITEYIEYFNADLSINFQKLNSSLYEQE